jgi:defect in organelle trafficking protein DotD
MVSRRLLPSFLAVSALALTACTPGAIRVKEPQLVASPDKVDAMLAQAADKASSALETLAAVEQKRTPSASIAPIQGAPRELMRAITVNYIGPAGAIVNTLADRAGYKYQALGETPSTPVVVSIDVTNQPLIEVLRSIGLQLGARADIRVDSAAQRVELMYAPVSGVGDVMTPLPMDGFKINTQ